MYYGWWIVAASVLVGMYVSGIVVYGFTTIIEPLVQEFHWSYASVSLAASVRGAESGLLAPVVGMLVDRWGARRLVPFGGLAVAAGLFLLSRATSLAAFYGAFIMMGVGASFCMSTVLVPTVNNWFHRRSGLANGITVSGFGLGGLMLPLMVTLMAQYGWRTAVSILAGGALIFLLPISLVFRQKPDQYSSLPNVHHSGSLGSTGPDAKEPRHNPEEAHKLFLRAATTKSFWFIAMALVGHAMAVMTVTTHVMPYLSSIGFTRMEAGAVATAIPLLSVLGRLGMGWTGDRASTKKICAVACGMMGLGTSGLVAAALLGRWAIVPSFVLFSVGFGGIIPMRQALIRERFGTERFGSLYGLLLGLSMIGGMVGPPLAGWVYDVRGDYGITWAILSVLSIASACLFLVAERRVAKTGIC